MSSVSKHIKKPISPETTKGYQHLFKDIHLKEDDEASARDFLLIFIMGAWYCLDRDSGRKHHIR